LLGDEVGTKRGGPLPGEVLRPFVIVVIGHPLLLLGCSGGVKLAD
jgi:hypothetical protein